MKILLLPIDQLVIYSLLLFSHNFLSMESFTRTDLVLTRDATNSLIDAVVKAISDVLISLRFEVDVYKVVIRACKPISSNGVQEHKDVSREFIMYGQYFCKLQIDGIEDKEAVAIANELNSKKIRGVTIDAEGPKLKAEKPIITEKERLARIERRSHEVRRKGRVIDRLRERIAAIPAPGGAAIFDWYCPLIADGTAGERAVDWAMMPRCLDPAHNFVENVPLGEDAAAEARAAAATMIDTTITDTSSTASIGRGSARIATTNDTGSVGTTRALRKRCQAESFVVALRGLLPPASAGAAPLHIVDFGSGTGNLCLPLAFLFPQCRFTAVDMKPQSMDILLRRAREAGLTNVAGVCGRIEEFEEPLDVSLALHACGQATDFALWQAERWRAAYIVCPCCIGKLKHRSAPVGCGVTDVNYAGDVTQCAPSQCAPCVTHPRSDWLFGVLGGAGQAEEWFGLMAKVGDISHGQAHSRGCFLPGSEAIARACKAHLEADRGRRMEEVGFRVALTRLLQAELTGKGELLAGVPEEGLHQGRFYWPDCWVAENAASITAAEQ